MSLSRLRLQARRLQPVIGRNWGQKDLSGACCKACLWARKFGHDDLADDWMLRHTQSVLRNLGKAVRINSVSFEPLGQREQIDIACRIALPQYPRALKEFAFNQIEAFAYRLRHFLLHGSDSHWIVGPSVAAHAVRMCDMHR